MKIQIDSEKFRKAVESRCKIEVNGRTFIDPEQLEILLKEIEFWNKAFGFSVD